MAGKDHGRVLEVEAITAPTSRKQRVKNRCAQITSPFLYSLGNWLREWCHLWVSLPILIKVIKIKPLRLISQVILYLIVVTIKINHQNIKKTSVYMNQVYMKYKCCMSRLVSHPQGISLCICKYSKTLGRCSV